MYQHSLKTNKSPRIDRCGLSVKTGSPVLGLTPVLRGVVFFPPYPAVLQTSLEACGSPQFYHHLYDQSISIYRGQCSSEAMQTPSYT